MEKQEKQKSNVCGIIGCCTGWLCPLSGLVLGIISLARKEPNKTIGIISIAEAVICWGIMMTFVIFAAM